MFKIYLNNLILYQ